MALTENGGTTMLVQPSGFGGGGFGGFGGDGWWVILLLLVFGGGWGRGGFGGGNNDLYPWLNNSEHISDGFRDQMLQTGVYSISDKLCSGFADVNTNITNASINNMQQLFSVQSALQNCCCENRAGLADVKYTIATEACATRSANSANTQAILDKLCSLELDTYRRENDQLRTQLNMANLAASQTAQTARILADNAAQTVALEQYLNPVPVPAYVVQNPNCCQNNCGCGGF